MAGGMLARLAANSRKAVAEGTYDVGAEMGRSGDDLAGIISAGGGPVLITEVKFASPSRGTIREACDPADVARQMVAGGASALSVLTQPHLFGGSPGNFMRVRAAVGVPMLMKDVVVDRVQVDAAAGMGADCVLLIQSLFDAGLASGLDSMIGYCHGAGLAVLLEVHTRAELDSALRTEADLIGINNRSLDTLEVDLGTTCRVLEGVDAGRPVVSESGISSPEDVRRLRGCGADAFLVGSGIMGRGDVGAAVRELAGAY